MKANCIVVSKCQEGPGLPGDPACARGADLWSAGAGLLWRRGESQPGTLPLPRQVGLGAGGSGTGRPEVCPTWRGGTAEPEAPGTGRPEVCPTTKPSALFCGLAILAFLAASPAVRAQQYHDNVVIILDASGSMKEKVWGSNVDKITAAKAALKTVLKTVPESTHIGLLVFSSKNLTDEWVYPLGPRKDEELMRAIDLPEAYNGTPLGHYLKRGADRLLQERAKQFGYGTYRLLVVTDGEAQDPYLVEAYTPEIIARGITVDVIGVNMRQAHTLATKVHSYRRANDPAALSRALAEILGEVSQARTDAAGIEAFALLAPLPAEAAAAAIQALSTSGNQPIGERPKREAAAPPAAPTRAAAPPPPSAMPASPPSPPPPPPAHKISGWLVIVAVIIVIGVLRSLSRGGRR